MCFNRIFNSIIATAFVEVGRWGKKWKSRLLPRKEFEKGVFQPQVLILDATKDQQVHVYVEDLALMYYCYFNMHKLRNIHVSWRLNFAFVLQFRFNFVELLLAH